jgi:hypothetical protein
MTWARHYKKRKSAARPIVKRMERREAMMKKSAKNKEESAKRVSSKKEEISPEKYFILKDGTHIKSIKELAMMMDSMSDDSFSFHVNEEKNDFANWIRDVFGKEDLADSLLALKCRKENQIALLKHALHDRI